jgi:hypothetical protein
MTTPEEILELIEAYANIANNAGYSQSTRDSAQRKVNLLQQELSELIG